MAYTQTDLDNIKAAILALATGTRKVRLVMGDKQIYYSETDLPALNALEAKIRAELGVPSGSRKRFFMISTSKGL